VARYDRFARVYAPLEPLFLIFPRARRKAVAAMTLHPGQTVLEVGAGTGRNLPYLERMVGPSGRVFAVDASPGMLAEAGRLVEGRGWTNVTLIEQDAAQLQLAEEVDGVLFSLSYSVLPEPAAALERAWRLLRPGGRVVVMDAGLPNSRLGRALRPVASLLVRLAPGDPHSDPWRDLSRLGSVETERFMAGIYYVCVVQKG
jgi:ubiquinone/menaquinone biosynthesis C-methylase UbiE